MIWLLAGIAVFALAMMVRGAAPARYDRADPPESLPSEDQVTLLQRYGTAADAERLIAEGGGDELAGLGYRPPE